MDNYISYNEMDQFNRNAKFVEKLGSTIIAIVFTWFFWYYSQNVEVDNVCFASKDSKEPVPPET
jgi:hypothetical protein